MITIDANTRFLKIIEPGLYGTSLGDIYDDVDEEYDGYFKQSLCSNGADIINEILSDIVNGDITVDEAKFCSPRFYNYENDWLEFDLKISEKALEEIKNMYYNSENEFLEFAKQYYGSYDGFISFAPYQKEKFETAINQNSGRDFDWAVQMFLSFLADKENDVFEVQRDYEDRVEEDVNKNGWAVYYD